MKKMLVLSLAFGLVLVFATAAHGASLSLSAFVGGSYYEKSLPDYDADGFSLGAEFAVGETYKIGVDYWCGSYDGSYDGDYSYLEVDFGYNLLDDDFGLDLFAGYIVCEYYGDKAQNVVIGADAVYNLSETLLLSATVKFSVWGDNNWGVYDNTTTGYSLGATYSFSEYLGVNLGYTYTKHTADGFNDFGMKGFTLGAVYSF